MSKTALLGAALTALTACGDGVPQLMNLRNTEAGPDEFSVLPTEPLEIPENLSQLPTPTPGGANRADPDPEADAIAALGGNIDRAAGGSGNLVGYTTRFGVGENIRGVLAAEDEEFRRRNDGGVMERLFDVNVYFEAYREMALDRYAELRRLRLAGIRTPTAPPEETDD